MQETVLLKKLNAELEVNKLGEHRKFKFISKHLGNDESAIDFLVEVLNYPRWHANKIAYSIEYRKIIYHNQKNNTSQ